MRKFLIIIIFLSLLLPVFAQEKCCSVSVSKNEMATCIREKIGNEVICPVTGGKFQITEKNEFSEYKGKIYYFCCPGCKGKFEKSPETYLQKKQKEHKH